jgi:hypothetical protein
MENLRYSLVYDPLSLPFFVFASYCRCFCQSVCGDKTINNCTYEKPGNTLPFDRGCWPPILNPSEADQFLEEEYERDHALNHVDQWNQADVHRLVSAFLGVRFPMALGLNKCDLPSSEKHIGDIKEALPIYGAHVATPTAARSEINFRSSSPQR